MKRVTLIVIAVLVLTVGLVRPQAQANVASQINNFSLALRYGSTTACFAKSGAVSPCSFNPLQMQTSAYINWGTTFGTSGYGIRDNGGTIEIKNSGGAWAAPSGGSNPLGTYLVQTATGAPANAQVMAALGTGLVINTTTTGVQSIYAGTSCTNQFPRSLAASGAATCATVALATDVSGILLAADFPALTGDITTPSGSVATTLASTGVGAGSVGSATAIPTFTVDAKGRLTAKGTATPQLTLTSTYFSSLAATSLTGIPGANITGTLATAAFPALTGDVTNSGGSLATTVGKIGNHAVLLGGTLTFSGAFATTITLTAATAVTLPTSGTLVSSAVTTLSSLSSIGTIATGVWQGTVVGAQYGGTGLATITAHSLMVGNGTGVVSLVAVCGTGTYIRGAAAADPICSTLILPNAATQGDLLVATAANTVGSVADVAVGQVLTSGGVSTVPAYSASPVVTSVGATTSTVVGGTAAVGAATTETTKTYAVTGLADGVATPTFTVTIPNGAESANLHVTIIGSLGAGGAIGANECSNTLEGNIAITRTTGVATVPIASAAGLTATACVAGATSETLAYAVSAVAGAVGATQTFTVNVTITKGVGGSNNHTVLAVARLANANASGVTLQ